jgi:hypothetical protein
VNKVQSVVVSKRNGPLLAEVARLWLNPADLVLDVTYGRGLFWTDYRPARLIAHDLYTVDGIDFRRLPEGDSSIDVVVFDPPYVSPGGRATSTIHEFNDRYGIDLVPRTVKETQELIAAGMKEATRVLVPGGRLLVKCADYISSGRFVQGRHHVVSTARTLGLEQVDEFVHHSGSGPQPKKNRDGTPRRQVHSRRAHSYLCVFQAPRVRSRHRRADQSAGGT